MAYNREPVATGTIELPGFLQMIENFWLQEQEKHAREKAALQDQIDHLQARLDEIEAERYDQLSGKIGELDAQQRAPTSGARGIQG